MTASSSAPIVTFHNITNIITKITDISPDLGELTESLGDASVQTMPLRYG
jgi:hypothetical protein